MVSISVPKGYNRLLAEKLMELANASLAGIVFVQFVPGNTLSVRVFVFGVLAFWSLHVLAYFIMQKGGEEKQ